MRVSKPEWRGVIMVNGMWMLFGQGHCPIIWNLTHIMMGGDLVLLPTPRAIRMSARDLEEFLA